MMDPSAPLAVLAQVVTDDPPTWEMGVLAVAVATLFWRLVAEMGEWKATAKNAQAELSKNTDVMRSMTDGMERQRRTIEELGEKLAATERRLEDVQRGIAAIAPRREGVN